MKPVSQVACVPHEFIAALIIALAGNIANAAPEERIDSLIRQLGHDEYSTREAANRVLESLGEPAIPALRRAAATDGDPEVRWRAKQAIQTIAAGIRVAAGRKDLEKLQGTWYTISTSFQGTKTPENRNDTITFEGDRYVQMLDGRLLAAGQITISDATASTRQMEYTVTAGP